ncbi:integrase [Pseudomonas sp. NZIPFR-PS5]|nr:integrase [Pseudomonas sp. NZIPFR-PS5]
MADNLELQGGTWHVRLAIPKDVQKAFGGRKILSQSLKTGSRREAMTRRLSVIDGWKDQIKAARAGRPLPEGWQDDALLTQSIITEMFQGQKRALIGEPAPELPKIDPAVQARMMGNPRFVAAFESFVREHLDRGVAGKIQLMDELSKGITGLIPLQLERDYRLHPEKVAEVRDVLTNPTSYKSSSPITPKRLEAYKAFRESRGGDQKHVDQQVGKMSRLSDFLKKKSLPLEFDSIDKWLLSLDRSPATLQQYVMAGTAFWKWATKYDAGFRAEFEGKANPFTGHELPQGGGREGAGEGREMYTPAEARKLYDAALSSGDKPLADLIMMGWYAGARIEEFCQLKATDVITVDGVLCFNFPYSKNAASERVTPIHPSLQKVVKRLMEDSTDGFLIPTDSENKYGKRSHAISKAFGRLRTSVGFGPRYVFHSFRHSVITLLVRADVPETLAQEIVGHDRKSVTSRVYSKGSTVAQKFAAVSTIPGF